MVKIDRTPEPPASLVVEAAKEKGSYRERDVIRQLREDSFYGSRNCAGSCVYEWT